ncbi:MAG: hypothetical protein ACRENK_07140 [Gemmatimonadaceae bacterium]
MQPRDGLLKRVAWGALGGGVVGVLCILVGVIRGLFFIAREGHIAPVSPDELRLLAFYVTGFIVAGILISAIWPVLSSGLAQYLGFSLAGVIVTSALLASDKGGVAAHEVSDWVIAVLVGVIMGCAFAYGFRRGEA